MRNSARGLYINMPSEGSKFSRLSIFYLQEIKTPKSSSQRLVVLPKLSKTLAYEEVSFAPSGFQVHPILTPVASRNPI